MRAQFVARKQQYEAALRSPQMREAEKQRLRRYIEQMDAEIARIDQMLRGNR